MQLRHPLAKALRLGFTVVVALAVFSNLSFLAWIAGLPLEMGGVKQGKMAEHYWLGPITLVYAVIVWGQLKRAALEK